MLKAKNNENFYMGIIKFHIRTEIVLFHTYVFESILKYLRLKHIRKSILKAYTLSRMKNLM